MTGVSTIKEGLPQPAPEKMALLSEGFSQMGPIVDVRSSSMASTGGERDKSVLFAEWALPHMDYIYTASLYLARNRVEAEDLFQEAYLRAYRSFHQFTPGTNCRAWLLTILRNIFKNRYQG